MKAKEIQNYLYDHPEYLFQDRIIQEKEKEFQLKKKRFDLFFRVDDERYIVEIKDSELSKEKTEQISEDYVFIKNYILAYSIKLIVVVTDIKEWQRTYLQEAGISCVVFDPTLPAGVPPGKKANKKKESNKENYWVVFLDKIDSQLPSDPENEKLKSLLLFDDSYINVFSFSADSPRSFVHKAQTGDFVLLITHLVKPVTVVPFRRLLQIKEHKSDRRFYLEARTSEKNIYLSYGAFQDRLKKINPDVKIISKAVKKLKSEEVIAVNAVFDNFRKSLNNNAE